MLNQLRDNPGARKARTRVGRGIGCTKGKTCGRGVKGQTSRSGVAIKGFEGGQMPIHRRLPKRGFKSPNRIVFSVLNLSDLQRLLDSGVISAKKQVTVEDWYQLGYLQTGTGGVKVLGRGEITAAVNLEVNAISASAAEAIRKAGGTVTILGDDDAADAPNADA